MKVHELIEELKKGTVQVEDEYRKLFSSDADLSLMGNTMANGMKFLFKTEDVESFFYDDNGELYQSALTFMREGVYILPYPICVCEFVTSRKDRVLLLLFQSVEERKKMAVSIFLKPPSDKWRILVMGLVVTADEKGLIGLNSHFPESYGSEEKEGDILAFIDSNLRFATLVPIALQAKGVIIKDCNDLKPLNKARAKKGRVPLFEYKTLVLDGYINSSKGSGAGTHASPRIHFRRGHVRTLPTGRKTPVNACVVGRKESGVVMKDYEVKISKKDQKMLNTPKTEAQKRKEEEEKRRRARSESRHDDLIYSAGIFSIVDSGSSSSGSCDSSSDFSSGFSCGD